MRRAMSDLNGKKCLFTFSCKKFQTILSKSTRLMDVCRFCLAEGPGMVSIDDRENTVFQLISNWKESIKIEVILTFKSSMLFFLERGKLPEVFR